MSYFTEQKTIRDLFTFQLYEIPQNQRKYVWKTEHWEDLFSDIEYAAAHNLEHFIGSIVLFKEPDSQNGLSRFTIVDGQQRIFTLTIFLAAILLTMKRSNQQNDYYGTEKYLFATDDKNQTHPVFTSSYHLGLKALVEAIRNADFGAARLAVEPLLNTTILAKRRDMQIKNAFMYFEGKLQSYIAANNNDTQCISHLRDTILNIKYVRIEASTEEDSYTIFEILNARGQSLADHELLKNYIMRYTSSAARINEIKNEWDDMEKAIGISMDKYLSHFLSHKYQITKSSAKDLYKAAIKNIKPNDVETFYKDFMLKAFYYAKMCMPVLQSADHPDGCTKHEYIIFSSFKSMRQEQFRPVVLSLMHQKDLQKLTGKDYEAALSFIKNFFICYTLIGKGTSNLLTSVISSYAYKLENNFSASVLKEFYSSLKARFPNKDWFKNSFAGIGYSNHSKFFHDKKEAERAKTVLTTFEEFLGNKNIGEYTIEHILPDSQAEDHANIGNLLPLEKTLNDKCKDKPLKDKKPFYKQSSFRSVQKFVSSYEGKEDTFNIENRMNHLAEVFYKMISS